MDSTATGPPHGGVCGSAPVKASSVGRFRAKRGQLRTLSGLLSEGCGSLPRLGCCIWATSLARASGSTSLARGGPGGVGLFLMSEVPLYSQ